MCGTCKINYIQKKMETRGNAVQIWHSSPVLKADFRNKTMLVRVYRRLLVWLELWYELVHLINADILWVGDERKVSSLHTVCEYMTDFNTTCWLTDFCSVVWFTLIAKKHIPSPNRPTSIVSPATSFGSFAHFCLHSDTMKLDGIVLLVLTALKMWLKKLNCNCPSYSWQSSKQSQQSS